MKKIITLALAALMSMTFLTACGENGGSKIADMKKKYTDNGYIITTFSKNYIADIAGLKEGFSATKKAGEWILHNEIQDVNIDVKILKFSNKTATEEYYNRTPSGEYWTIFINGLYICHIFMYAGPPEYEGTSKFNKDSEVFKTAEEIFKSFFK